MFTIPGTYYYIWIISWKCVANKQKGWICVCKYLLSAHDKPKPSFVLVPLPSSSIKTKLFYVAVFNIQAVSIIYPIKVEIPLTCWSDAPTLQIIESIIGH